MRRQAERKKAPLFLLRFARKPLATLLGESLAFSRFLHKKSGGTTASFAPLFMHHEAEQEKVSHFVRNVLMWIASHSANVRNDENVVIPRKISQ